MVANGAIADGKTIVLVQQLQLRQQAARLARRTAP